MTQRDRLRDLIVNFCNERQRRTFSLKELNQTYGQYENIGIGGQTPHNTIQSLLQKLRDLKFLTFDKDKRGHYTLCADVLLGYENIDMNWRELELLPVRSPTKEYLIEVLDHDRALVQDAKNKLGRECMYGNCRNTFSDDRGEPYVEVHHIIPLSCGGADAIRNLSVLCGHHHKQAHFAHQQERDELKKYLLAAVRERL
ncbi:MAG: HNH endonuclease [Gammaproteobacteria bacterium AqS3]|nr:HNH endonuclease [Gammaproteobacteria bacterium AqS3]